MKPELPPMNREALEAKVTALLLGELPEGEAALMRELIARDAELAKFHAQLGLTLGLLRETVATPEPAPAAPMKFGEDRREKLLAQFKTVAPKEFDKPPHWLNSRLVPLAATAAVIAVLVGVTDPDFIRAHTKSMHNTVGMDVNSVPPPSNQGAIGVQGGTAPSYPGLSGRATRSRGMSRMDRDPSHPEAAPAAKDENLVRREPDPTEIFSPQNAQRMRRSFNSAANTLAENNAESPGGQSQSTQSSQSAQSDCRGQETVETIDGRAITPRGPVPGSAVPIASTAANANANNVEAQLHELEGAGQNSQSSVPSQAENQGQNYSYLNSTGLNANQSQGMVVQTWGPVGGVSGRRDSVHKSDASTPATINTVAVGGGFVLPKPAPATPVPPSAVVQLWRYDRWDGCGRWFVGQKSEDRCSG